jgi:hypothetical protein
MVKENKLLFYIIVYIDKNWEEPMPIPREQFQQRSDTTENNILNFLKEHPEEAYNAKEIAEASAFSYVL